MTTSSDGYRKLSVPAIINNYLIGTDHASKRSWCRQQWLRVVEHGGQPLVDVVREKLSIVNHDLHPDRFVEALNQAIDYLKIDLESPGMQQVGQITPYWLPPQQMH